MVDFAHFAGLDDEADGSPQAGVHERPVDRGGREQGGDGHFAFLGLAPVGQDHNPRARTDGLDRRAAEFAQGGFQIAGEVGGKRRGGVAPVGDLGKPRQFIVRQDRTAQFDQSGVFGGLLQDIAQIADVGHQRHDEFLADRVDRRVRHLREKLVEVVEQRAALLGKRRERRVVAHRTDRLLARFGHRVDDELEILVRIAEEPLAAQEVAGHGGRHDFGEKTLDGDAVLFNPAAVGTPAGIARLDFRIVHDAVVRQVEIHHRTRTQTAVFHDFVRRNVHDTRFGRQNEEIGARQGPARRTQSVAVQRRAGRDAVREGDRGGSVPRFHEGGVVFVEAADILAHVVLGAPGLGHEHEHGVRRIASGRHEQLEHVVQGRRIALFFADERQNLLHVLAENRGEERFFARFEGVQVAFEGVDLAIVGEHAEGVRQFPGREGVRRVALVHEGDGGGEVRVGEVRIELLHLGGEEKTLIDDRPGRKRADIAVFEGFFDGAADDVEQAFIGAGDEELADARQHATGDRPDRLGLDGHLAPAQNLRPVRRDRLFEDFLFADRAEHHGDAVLALLGQIRHDFAEKAVRNLDEQARAVAGTRVVSRRAAVHKALEDGQTRRHDLAVRYVVQIRDKPHAAGVVLEVGAVEAPLMLLGFHIAVHPSSKL